MSFDSADEKNSQAADSIGITLSPLSDSTWLSPGDSSETAHIAAGFLPGYEIIRELHRGGQGIVFLAIQKSMQREVAIKVMKEGPFADATDRARFDREVHILAKLKHPNIVTIHDSGRIAGCDYFVMDYVAGMSLDEFVEQTKPSLRALLELFRCICETVEVAHVRNIIHRDLKPGNIRVDTEGRPRILDFGLAKVVGAPRASNATEQGMFVGSIPWASPEQARGELETLDPRTDVYSLGVILYQLLTGRFPYNVVGPPHEVLDRIRHEFPRDPRHLRKVLDRDLATIILKCLSKERAQRYASAGTLASDLARYLRGEPIDARRRSVAYSVVARSRVWGRRHPAIRRLATLLASILIVLLVPISSIVFSRTPLGTAYRRWAVRVASTIAPPAKLELVRVIAITPNTKLESLALAENLTGISTDQNKRASLRRLHGRFMERLAAARPRAVVWDFYFRTQSEFDADFVAGVRALHAVGTDVVVGTKTWKLDASGIPEVSPTMLPEIRWGSLRVNFDDKSPWTVELFMLRPGSEPNPSLALAALAAYRNPQAEYAVELDDDLGSITVNYWRPSPKAPRLKLPISPSDRVALANFEILKRDAVDGDIRADDGIGYYAAQMPPTPVLEAATIDYADILKADPDRLREKLGGRLVLIADVSQGSDVSPYPDGRILQRCFGHATAIEQLLQGSGLRTPTDTQAIIQNLVGAAIGCVIGLLLARRTAARLSALLTLAVMSVVASLSGLLIASYLSVPIVPMIYAIVGCELTAWVERGTTANAAF